MAMAAIIYKKGPPDNFVWEEIKVGVPERGQVRLRSTAVGVNFADTYHRAGIPHPMIVGEPQGIVPVQTSTLEAAKGRSCASQQILSANVRFGSKADTSPCPRNVCFTPESRH